VMARPGGPLSTGTATAPSPTLLSRRSEARGHLPNGRQRPISGRTPRLGLDLPATVARRRAGNRIAVRSFDLRQTPGGRALQTGVSGSSPLSGLAGLGESGILVHIEREAGGLGESTPFIRRREPGRARAAEGAGAR
jgi:hypothetical protein